MIQNRALLGILGALLAGLCLQLSAQAYHGIEDPALALGIAGVATSLSLGLLAFAFAIATSSEPSLHRRLGMVRGRLSPFAIFLLCLGTLTLGFGLDGLLEISGLRDGSNLEKVDEMMIGARGSLLLLLVFGVGIAPGFGEELLFRGFFQIGLARRFGNIAAVLISALLFSLLHWDLAHSSGTFFLGVFLGYAALLDGSLRAPIFCHITNNFVVVLALAFPSQTTESAATWTPILCALAIVLIILLVVRNLAPKTAPLDDSTPCDSAPNIPPKGNTPNL